MLYGSDELEGLGINKEEAMNKVYDLVKFLTAEELITLSKLFSINFDENGNPHLIGN